MKLSLRTPVDGQIVLVALMLGVSPRRIGELYVGEVVEMVKRARRGWR